MSDWIWLIACFIYASGAVAATKALGKKGALSSEGARKVLHVAVSLTAPVLAYGIDDPCLRLIGPAAFIIINAVMPHQERRTGLVLYPLSFLILAVCMDCGIISPSSFVSGCLAMGIGDAAAAAAGMRWGRHPLGSKSLEGSAAMLAVSFIIFMLSSHEPWHMALAIAAAAAAAEAVSPRGLDNLTVPVLSSFLVEVL